MVLYVVVLMVFLAAPLSAQYGDSYNIPEPEIQAFTPKGFRVSIEDSPGVRLFAFHGNINRELRDLEAGTFSKDIIHKRDGKWTFEERKIRLQVGDVINYWLFVIKDDLGYRLDDGHFEVKELIDSPFPAARPQSGRPPPRPTQASLTTTTEGPTTIPTIAAENKGSVSRLCELTILNTTQALLSLQAEMNELRKMNQQLVRVIEKSPDGKKLTLSGRIPPDDEALMTVKFMLREKLDLNPDIVSAVKNSDNSITFEVSTLSEKLEILQAAKERLTSSRIVIS